MTVISVTSHEDQYTLLTEMFWTTLQRKSKQTFYVQRLSFPENRAVYDMCKTSVEPVRPQTTCHMHFECWIPTAIKTLSEFVDIAFPPQQRFNERPSVLNYTHIAYLVLFNLNGRGSSNN
jgi:hypothetical protein